MDKGSVIPSFRRLVLCGFWRFAEYGAVGLFTLGTEVPRDNSIFLLAEGIIAVIVTCFGLAVYYANLRDAYQNGKRRDEQKELSSLKEQYHNLIAQGYPYLISGPSLFILVFAVVFPILFSFALAFTNYNLYHSPPARLVDWVGIKTFSEIFTVDIWRSTFLDVLAWTIVWTLVASTLQVGLGILLAVVVNQKEVRFKKIFRTILVLPWAVPGFVTILVFAGLFNDSFGAFNHQILAAFGIDPIPWMTNANWTKLALILMQGWLGFPYVFIVTTGVLQSIPDDLYEAATIDGASASRVNSGRNRHPGVLDLQIDDAVEPVLFSRRIDDPAVGLCHLNCTVAVQTDKFFQRGGLTYEEKKILSAPSDLFSVGFYDSRYHIPSALDGGGQL